MLVFEIISHHSPTTALPDDGKRTKLLDRPVDTICIFPALDDTSVEAVVPRVTGVTNEPPPSARTRTVPSYNPDEFSSKRTVVPERTRNPPSTSTSQTTRSVSTEEALSALKSMPWIKLPVLALVWTRVSIVLEELS